MKETAGKRLWVSGGDTLSGTVTDIGEARKRRLTPTGRVLLGTLELASYLSPYGPEPPSEELLGAMLALPPSDRAELAELLGAKALEMTRQAYRVRR